MTQATDEAGRQEGLAGQATTKVQEAAGAAQETASQLREEGSERLRDQFDRRSSEAGTQARSLATALRRSGNELDQDGNSGAARLAGQAADRIEQLGAYLEQKTGDDFMRDIQTFARRRPWMLAGLGMLVGVAAARFVKASSEERHGGSWNADGQPVRRGLVAPQAGGYAQSVEGTHAVEGSDTVGTDVPEATSDDPLARDPYAGSR